MESFAINNEREKKHEKVIFLFKKNKGLKYGLYHFTKAGHHI